VTGNLSSGGKGFEVFQEKCSGRFHESSNVKLPGRPAAGGIHQVLHVKWGRVPVGLKVTRDVLFAEFLGELVSWGKETEQPAIAALDGFQERQDLFVLVQRVKEILTPG
jgi:hypothetical protein